jgi:hypothetical protein
MILAFTNHKYFGLFRIGCVVPYDTISVGIDLIIYSAGQSKESELRNNVCKSEKNRLSKFFNRIAEIYNFAILEIALQNIYERF